MKKWEETVSYASFFLPISREKERRENEEGSEASCWERDFYMVVERAYELVIRIVN